MKVNIETGNLGWKLDKY